MAAESRSICLNKESDHKEISEIIDVTKSNFFEVSEIASNWTFSSPVRYWDFLFFFQKSNDFIKRVSTASWIAIDEEMSGIQLPPSLGGALKKDESPEDRYSTFKKVSERYSIIQLGISLFEKVPETTGKFDVVSTLFSARPHNWISSFSP